MNANKMTIYGSIISILLIMLLTCVLNARTAKADGQQPQQNSKRVLDLGELEVEGEVRRPPVDWIDSSKRIKGQIPGMYAAQFRKLEEELLKPIKMEKAQKELRHVSR